MKVYDFHAHPVTNEFIKAMDDLGINVIEDDALICGGMVWVLEVF